MNFTDAVFVISETLGAVSQQEHYEVSLRMLEVLEEVGAISRDEKVKIEWAIDEYDENEEDSNTFVMDALSEILSEDGEK